MYFSFFFPVLPITICFINCSIFLCLNSYISDVVRSRGPIPKPSVMCCCCCCWTGGGSMSGSQSQHPLTHVLLSDYWSIMTPALSSAEDSLAWLVHTVFVSEGQYPIQNDQRMSIFVWSAYGDLFLTGGNVLTRCRIGMVSVTDRLEFVWWNRVLIRVSDKQPPKHLSRHRSHRSRPLTRWSVAFSLQVQICWKRCNCQRQ